MRQTCEVTTLQPQHASQQFLPPPDGLPDVSPTSILALDGLALYLAQAGLDGLRVFWCIDQALACLTESAGEVAIAFEQQPFPGRAAANSFGALVCRLHQVELSEIGNHSPEAQARLALLAPAAASRNKLAHDWWWGRAECLATADGLRMVAREFTEYVTLFAEWDALVRGLVATLCRVYPLPVESIWELVAYLKGQGGERFGTSCDVYACVPREEPVGL